MKTIYCLFGALAVLASTSLWAADTETPARKPVTVSLSEDDFRTGNAHPTKEVSLAPGDKLVIKLGSNPTTGYRWGENPANSNAAVLKQTKHEYASSNAKSKDGEPMAGAGGTEIWTFDAVKAGEAALDFSYGRPWQGGEKGTWTLKLTVRVR